MMTEFDIRKMQGVSGEKNEILLSVIESAIKEVVHGCLEYLKTKEIEITKRAIIEAERERTLEIIRAQKEIVLGYFDYTFKERKLVIDEMFIRLDKAVKYDEIDEIEKYLSGIIGVLQKNPFENFLDFQYQLENREYILKL